MNLVRLAATAVAVAALGLGVGACSDSTPAAPAPVNAPEPVAAPASTPANYTLRVTGTVEPQMINWNFDGSSGSGSTVPFEKRVTAQRPQHSGGTVTAVTSSGTSGSLTCEVVDNATGETVDRQTAEADGSSYAYASVACSIPVEMNMDAYSSSIVGGALAACMEQTGMSEAECRQMSEQGLAG